MSLSWWSPGASGDFDVETPKTAQQREPSPTDHLPGSPSIVFLLAPVVVARMPGEKTGLLPTQRQRPESRASKQIKRCQLVAVVVMSVVTVAVIILFSAGDSRSDNRRR